MTHAVDHHGHDAGAHSEPHLPKPTFWPLALGVGFVLLPLGFIAWITQAGGQPSTDRFYIGQGMMLGGLAFILFAIWGWLYSNAKANEPALAGPDAGKFSMWAYLGTECIIFGGLIANAVYVLYRDGDLNEGLQHFWPMMTVSANTFFLLISSLMVVLGLSGIQRGNRGDLIKYILATAALGIVFLGIQAYEYSNLYNEGLSITSSQFGQAFFMLTGFHGLHVFVGVIWALVVVWIAARGGFSAEKNMGVEIFGLYWHFVDVVWIIIFTVVYLI